MFFFISMLLAGFGFAFIFGGDTQLAKLCAGGCAFFLVADQLAGRNRR